MIQKIGHYAVNELPNSNDLVIGGIYYLANGSQYVINSAKIPVKISDVIFVNDLPMFGMPDKLYVLSKDNGISLLVWESLRFIEILNNENSIKKNTFIFFTNRLLTGEIQTRAKIPYNSKIKKLETIMTSTSISDLKYLLEKSTDGITFTPIGNIETIIAGNVLQTSNLIDEVLVNENDILRLVLITANSDVKGLTINISVEEVI